MTNDVVDKMRNAIARLDAGELTLLLARMDAPPASNGEIEITFVLRFGVDPAFLRRYAEPTAEPGRIMSEAESEEARAKLLALTPLNRDAKHG